jgi:hypothetical protein
VILEDIEAALRLRIKDAAKPYLRPSSELWAHINEAQEEAAIRADLLPEASNTDYTQVAVTASTGSYTINARWIRITHAEFVPADSTDPVQLALYSDTQDFDSLFPDWRGVIDTPTAIVVQQGRVRFNCLPETAGTLKLEGYRLPLVDMDDDADVPEIQAKHHRHLVDWAEYRAFSKPDPDREDPARAQQALERFEAYFGRRPDAQSGQPTESPQHVRAW